MIRRTLFVISEYNDQYYVCLILNDNRILLIKSLCDQQLISYNIASTMLMRCKVVRGIYQKTLNLCFMLVGNRQQWVFAISWNWFYLVDLNLRYAFFYCLGHYHWAIREVIDLCCRIVTFMLINHSYFESASEHQSLQGCRYVFLMITIFKEARFKQGFLLTTSNHLTYLRMYVRFFI